MSIYEIRSPETSTITITGRALHADSVALAKHMLKQGSSVYFFPPAMLLDVTPKKMPGQYWLETMPTEEAQAQSGKLYVLPPEGWAAGKINIDSTTQPPSWRATAQASQTVEIPPRAAPVVEYLESGLFVVHSLFAAIDTETLQGLGAPNAQPFPE